MNAPRSVATKRSRKVPVFPLAGPLLTMLVVGMCHVLPLPPAVEGVAWIAAVLLVAVSAVASGPGAGLLSGALVVGSLTFQQPLPPGLADGPDPRLLTLLAMLAPAAGFVPFRGRDRKKPGGSERRERSKESRFASESRVFLAETAALLDASLGFDRTVEKVCELATPAVCDWCALYLVGENGRARRAAVGHADPDARRLIWEALRTAPIGMNRRHPLADVEEVLESGEMRAIADPGTHTHLEIYATNPRERMRLQELSARGLLIVPLVVRERVAGALALVMCDPARRFGSDEVHLAGEFARRAGVALENARLYESAIAASREAETASNRITNILESISDGFIALDREWCFTYANGEAERLLGMSRDQLLGRNIWNIFPRSVGSPFYRAYHKALSEQKPVTFQAESRWSDAWLEVHVYPSREGLSVYFRDVTSQRETEEALRRSEEQLRQSQKMEAVGRLAGGVAHDFNNLLTPIGGYTEFLLTRMAANDPLRNDLMEIQKAAERASALTRQLLAFGRKQVHQPQVLDLNAMVADLEKMLRRLIGEDIDLVTLPDLQLGRIMADPGQIEQILLNLVVNARDAMPSGGTVFVETRNMELDVGATGFFTDKPEPGSYVVLSVSDTGLGIDREILPSIFEPFFTTKEKGKGTGLGLSTVYGIVKQSGGNISVASTPGHGTRFNIFFKRTNAEAAPTRSYAPPESLPQGTECVLLVEDETAVREFTAKVLRSNGYTVIEAENGVGGLAAAESFEETIDLLLTDVVMPRMGGRELSEKLSQGRPGLSVLFMSGYAESEIVHQGILEEGRAFLQKPFTAAVLLREVRRVLGGGEPAGGANGSSSAETSPSANGSGTPAGNGSRQVVEEDAASGSDGVDGPAEDADASGKPAGDPEPARGVRSRAHEPLF